MKTKELLEAFKADCDTEIKRLKRRVEELEYEARPKPTLSERAKRLAAFILRNSWRVAILAILTTAALWLAYCVGVLITTPLDKIPPGVGFTLVMVGLGAGVALFVGFIHLCIWAEEQRR